MGGLWKSNGHKIDQSSIIFSAFLFVFHTHYQVPLDTLCTPNTFPLYKSCLYIYLYIVITNDFRNSNNMNLNNRGSISGINIYNFLAI